MYLHGGEHVASRLCHRDEAQRYVVHVDARPYHRDEVRAELKILVLLSVDLHFLVLRFYHRLHLSALHCVEQSFLLVFRCLLNVMSQAVRRLSAMLCVLILHL